MTTTDYNALLALSLIILVLLLVPPFVGFFRMIQEGERDLEAAKRRIAARQLAGSQLPAIADISPDPEEQP